MYFNSLTLMQRTKYLNNLVLSLVLSVLFFACRNKPEDTENEEKRQYPEIKNLVETIVLQQTDFNKELVSNGKLKALKQSQLRFNTSGVLQTLNVKNGSFINKGEIIARLEQTQQAKALERAKVNMQKAGLMLHDNLIGMGHTIADTATMPPDRLEIAKIRSGYTDAKIELGNAAFNLQSTVMYAPFSGVVANLKTKPYEQVAGSEAFCNIIDNSLFEVEFSVIETEIGDISVGKEIAIQPFVNNAINCLGKITEINPLIDANGLIAVKAQVNSAAGLIDGMNVKVLINNKLPHQLVVPRKAVVLRDNQEVLFRYQSNDSTAYWTYVDILYENSTSYAVVANKTKEASLNAGDTIIVSNNLNLAHESKVEIVNGKN